MNITEQAAQVLQEIDAALAICAPVDGWFIEGVDNNDKAADEIAAFIASARTVCPTALRMLKTAIERRLKCYLSNRRFEDDPALTSWQDLTELFNQWNSK
tara:strand:- start:45 stop:344 length:300 start_codon:yes stop_codon:yes gene_type:complete